MTMEERSSGSGFPDSRLSVSREVEKDAGDLEGEEEKVYE